jgi:predicted acyl esterase
MERCVEAPVTPGWATRGALRRAPSLGTLEGMIRDAIAAFSLGILALGCGSSSAPNATVDAGGKPDSSETVPKATFDVRGSVEQVDVWNTPPGSNLELVGPGGAVVQTGKSDTLGSFIFRKVTPGDGYGVTVNGLAPPNTIHPVRVMSIANSLPGQDFYKNQKLKAGYNYITTRDGTQLAAYITLPGPVEKGPYPTVVNYSGYNPAQPGAPIAGYKFLCSTYPVLCDAPNDPSALIADFLGYATVGVNMRGTGCSGGAYDYFEELQLLDGYDIIEAVAAQSWVVGNRVGMTGLSYPGIAELFVAQTHPPSLAAITPLSVIGNTYSTARPGGIFNDGFALEWITEVLDKAGPYGQGWEKPLVDAGDKVCKENQLLHGQKVDVIQEARDVAYYSDLFAPLNPTAFVHEIDVPVFLAGAFEDEQTGPFFFTLLDQFKSAPIKRFTVYNGVHPDGFAPQVIVEWKAFLDIYVAHQVPVISASVRSIAPELFENFFMVSVDIPPDRFAGYPTWEKAKAAYEAEGSVRALFEDGASKVLGAPVHTFEMDFDAWPPSSTEPLRLYFQPDGSLQTSMPTGGGAAASSFELDPAAGHRGILAPGGDVWDPLPDYDWKPLPAGYDVVMDSAPLPNDLVMLGSASVDLWIRSSVEDADLEVNLTEIRPDGQERYVQSGWLRASLRKLASTASPLWPEHTYTQADEALLVPGQWTAARVGFPSFGHVFRKGSHIRVTVDTPGDSRAAWTFALKTFPGKVVYDVGHSPAYPSSILLPVLNGAEATTPLPPCPSLRAQQCRTYVPYTNTPAPP